ncbi:MAG: hypothetical protein QMD94_01290 [Candidatus Omnitrophota bacterium]|nr:hypothetical protein [Candidatus Omnitrophota bacterium]
MMIKEITTRKFIFIALVAIALSGCTFIVKDDHATKYYGIDEQRGSEYLNQILEKQQQVYQAEKVAAGTEKP